MKIYARSADATIIGSSQKPLTTAKGFRVELGWGMRESCQWLEVSRWFTPSYSLFHHLIIIRQVWFTICLAENWDDAVQTFIPSTSRPDVCLVIQTPMEKAKTIRIWLSALYKNFWSNLSKISLAMKCLSSSSKLLWKISFRFHLSRSTNWYNTLLK